MTNQTRMSLSPSCIQTLTVGPGITPGHVPLALVGCTTDRELHPAPKVEYLVVVIITRLVCHCEGAKRPKQSYIYGGLLRKVRSQRHKSYFN